MVGKNGEWEGENSTRRGPSGCMSVCVCARASVCVECVSCVNATFHGVTLKKICMLVQTAVLNRDILRLLKRPHTLHISQQCEECGDAPIFYSHEQIRMAAEALASSNTANHQFYVLIRLNCYNPPFLPLTAGCNSVCTFTCAIKVIVDQLEHCIGHLSLFLVGTQINWMEKCAAKLMLHLYFRMLVLNLFYLHLLLKRCSVFQTC